MVTGPNRLILDKFFKSQAEESLAHAQQAGELLTGLGGHPSQKIPTISESNKHSVKDLLLKVYIMKKKLYHYIMNCLIFLKIKAYILRNIQEK